MAQQPVIVNNPGSGNGNRGVGGVVTAIVILIVVLVFIFYGIPRLRGGSNKTEINVPDKIQVQTSPGY